MISNNNIQSIQILRGLAALSVVYFHITIVDRSIIFLPIFGSYGVDIFFVISGFVMSLIVFNGEKPKDFALNRIARIVPLYWILTTALLLLTAIKPNLLNSTTFNLINYAKSLLFIPYFKENGALNPLLAVGWTLNYEMLFYLCIFISLIISKKFYAILTISILSLLFLFSPYIDNKTLSAFFSEKLIFEFIFGMISFQLYSIIKSKTVSLYIPITIFLLSLIFMSIAESYGLENRLWAFGIPSVCVLISFLMLEKIINVKNKFIIFFLVIGDASYAIYLSHLYVVEFFHKIISIFSNFLIFTIVFKYIHDGFVPIKLAIK